MGLDLNRQTWSPHDKATVDEKQAAMDNPKHWAHRQPAPTVTGTVGHVGGKQAEGHLNLTTAEGARLQGFPDGYRFQGNKGQVSLQIGNAMPPLLAEVVLNEAASPAAKLRGVAA